jgi:hypothetical protein
MAALEGAEQIILRKKYFEEEKWQENTFFKVEL